MKIRLDYLRTLEIFLDYEKINGKHLIRYSDFVSDFNTIFWGNPDAEECLKEMYSLDYIKEVDADHIFGEEGILLLDKGWDILKSERSMEISSEKLSEIEVLRQKIASTPDKGHKQAYLITLSEISKTYIADCNTATISLCGKILEIFFYEILQNSNFKEDLYRIDDKTGKKYPRNDLSLWKLRNLASKLPTNITDLLPNNNVINTISEYRNASIHYSDKNYSPSKRVVNGIIDFLIEILDKYFSLSK